MTKQITLATLLPRSKRGTRKQVQVEAPTKARTVFHVVYDRERKKWATNVAGFSVRPFEFTKEVAASYARAVADGLWRHDRIKTQVVIHNRDGKIAREYTYGADPQRSRG